MFFCIPVSFDDFSVLTKNSNKVILKSEQKLGIHHNEPHFNKT